MKIIECEQSSLEWLLLRSGVVTASEADELFTPELKPRTGEMVNTLLHRKVAEIWIGANLPGFSTMDMEIGKVLEEEVRPWYQLTFDEEITPVGFVTSDDGCIGCSPDGRIGEGWAEIKCPLAQTHVGYLIGGEIPKTYRAQVHFSMLVTGAPWWKFVSYRRGFPPLVKTVYRDENVMSVMQTTMDGFLERLEDSVQRIEEMAGRNRPKKYTLAPEPAVNQPEPEYHEGLVP